MRLGALVGLVWLVGCGGNSEGDLPEDPMEPTAGETSSAGTGGSSEPMAGKGGSGTAGTGGAGSSGGKGGAGGTSPAGGRAGASGSAGAGRGGTSSSAGESGSGGQPGAGMGGTGAGSAGMGGSSGAGSGGIGGTEGGSSGSSGAGPIECSAGKIHCGGECWEPTENCEGCGVVCPAGLTCAAGVCADEFAPVPAPACSGFWDVSPPANTCAWLHGRFTTQGEACDVQGGTTKTCSIVNGHSARLSPSVGVVSPSAAAVSYFDAPNGLCPVRCTVDDGCQYTREGITGDCDGSGYTVVIAP